jgi:hypothetical protein
MKTVGPPPRPKSMRPDDLTFRWRRSVRWLDPRQLLDTGWRAAVSLIFGSYSDKREVEAVLDGAFVDDRTASNELWIDYAADLGDGFKATYTVARLLGQPTLDVVGPAGDGPASHTERGGILVLGGDQVYPTAKASEYEDRFTGPMRAALPWTNTPHPNMFAIPGNHDWYDGLTSFLRVFCQKKWIGGWRTEQTRSYFALRLPHGWWLWGIDIQLNSYIDTPQLSFFTRTVAPKVAPGDSIILCTATPAWVKVEEKPAAWRNLRYFERNVIEPTGARVAMYLSGDLHHYARYQEEPVGHAGPPRQRITAGGGGAFLHGTHQLPRRLTLDEGETKATYTRRATYPSRARSRYFAWSRIWLVGALNHVFALFVGTVYMLMAWLVAFGRTIPDPAKPEAGLSSVVGHIERGDLIPGLTRSPVAIVLLLLLARGLIGFAKPLKDPLRRLFGRVHPALGGLAPWAAGGLGIVHAAVHCVAAGAVAVMASQRIVPDDWTGFGATLSYLGGAVGLGAVAGSLVMALYLWGSGLLQGHLNEAFSAMRIIDRKCFLRMHLAGDGSLTIYPIGVNRVARRFRAKPNGDDEEAWLEPVDPVTPHLIEDPVVIPPPRAPQPTTAPSLEGAMR